MQVVLSNFQFLLKQDKETDNVNVNALSVKFRLNALPYFYADAS